MKKSVKKIISVLLCVVLIAACFAGCSSSDNEKYSDTSLIIGYVPDSSPFITVGKDGKVGGFEADVIEKIFKSIKGDFKSYDFEDGDIVIMFSDGIDESEYRFIKELLLSGDDLKHIVSEICAKAELFRPTVRTDDVTVIGIRVKSL